MIVHASERKHVKRKRWNRCDGRGKFIPMADFDAGSAVRYLATPDTAFSSETFRTVCPKCRTHGE